MKCGDVSTIMSVSDIYYCDLLTLEVIQFTVFEQTNISSRYKYIPQFPLLHIWIPVQAAPLPHIQVVPEQVFSLVQAGSHVGVSEIIITTCLIIVIESKIYCN
jgi:hypothetical protein